MLRHADLLGAWLHAWRGGSSGCGVGPLARLAACTRDAHGVIVEWGHQLGLSAWLGGALMPANHASRAVERVRRRYRNRRMRRRR
jgi:hypothetical protein